MSPRPMFLVDGPLPLMGAGTSWRGEALLASTLPFMTSLLTTKTRQWPLRNARGSFWLIRQVIPNMCARRGTDDGIIDDEIDTRRYPSHQPLM